MTRPKAPILKNLVPVTGTAFASSWAKLCAPFFSHTHYWYEVDILKVSYIPPLALASDVSFGVRVYQVKLKGGGSSSEEVWR